MEPKFSAGFQLVDTLLFFRASSEVISRMREIPTYSADLIEQLLKEYPETTITPETPLEHIMFRAGQRDLVTRLSTILERTKDKDPLNVRG